MFEIIKKAHLRNMPKYIMNFPSYYKIAQYEAYIEKLKRNGLKYGMVHGSGEDYIYDINDRAIPTYMFFNKRTFSDGEIDLFFKLSEKFGHHIDETWGGVFLGYRCEYWNHKYLCL